jgi:two-component system phosphate regulon sensor histidine kinase PhoR
MIFGIRFKLVLVAALIIAAAMAGADAFLSRALTDERTQAIREELFVRLALVQEAAARLDAERPDRWDAVADALGPLAHARLTFVRTDGVVLGDSELTVDELASVENHLSREEIAGALKAGQGDASRLSSTTQRRMLYVAAPMPWTNGPRVVARLSVALTEIDEGMLRLRRLLLAVSAFALLLSLTMSTLAAHWISRSVRSLTEVAKRMGLGDLSVRVGTTGTDEVAQLGRALDQLAQSLSESLEQLRSERDLFDRVLRGMREGVLLVDDHDRVAVANPALREMLLLSADVVGTSPLEVAHHAALKSALDRARHASSPVTAELELGGLRPRRVLVLSSALSGEPGGVLAVFVDVTELRRLESLRRDFVANVSHELRTPIASVLSAAETLASGALADAKAAPRFVSIIEQNATRLRLLVEDLLDLSRIEAQEMKLKPETFELGAFARPLLESFDDRAKPRRLQVSAVVRPTTLPIHTDRRALDQILRNLIDNAVKYCTDGATIILRADADAAGRVFLAVEDSGPGIEAKHLPRLFERFYRVDTGRSRELGGTGLGLAIVKHLVEALGGHIQVDSSPSSGTRFSFSLPPAPGSILER